MPKIEEDGKSWLRSRKLYKGVVEPYNNKKKKCARIRRDEKEEYKFKWPHQVQRQRVTQIAAHGFQAYENVITKLSPSVHCTHIPTVVL